jgi:heme exporter protein C
LEELRPFIKILFLLAMGVATVWSFHIPPAMGFQQPELARIFVWHFPCPIIATVMLLMGGWFSFKHLKTRDAAWDERAASANELGFVFCMLTMATGILFSEVQWGTWWQWDPRQTSFLVVLFIYAAYFAVRGAFPDHERRAANAAAYALTAILPALFLIFVFPRLPQVVSFHPSDSILKGKIKGEYAYSVMTIMALISILTGWLYQLRVRAGLAALRKEFFDERLATDSRNPAPTGVVRPVRISPED